ncbi:hypothetical protein GGG17_06710 [Arsenicicoccus sp. MKL-02]|uniref:DDE Tnp4 domain-containing protein n=1 Tax=Arsenicicoccus cauae TaxID=2663847 RepID=A0A6I3IG87_9MICO|nr:hypothetical protein [Arsenicicoccus cauae]MTB71663.1 hypothetical protein [Arsenicicoccus cauae]
MLSYRATLPVLLFVVRRVSTWLWAHRRVRDARPRQRAATCWTQAVLVPRWLIKATRMHRLAADHGLSLATAYRYLHEAIDVVADRAPTLEDVLADQLDTAAPFVCLDGTLIHTTRCCSRSTSTKGYDAWYSGKHHAHGGNIQVLTDHTGFPIWTSPVEPGNPSYTRMQRALRAPAERANAILK